MAVKLHPHARERLVERGATEQEVVEAVQSGESYPVKFGRVGFRRNFPYNSSWRGKRFSVKQVEAIAVRQGSDWLVLTVLVKFF
jgi:hypothetical protein